RAGPHRGARRHDPGADRAGLREPQRDPGGGGQRPRPPREDDRLPPEPRRLPGDERGLRAACRRSPAGTLDGRGRPAAVRRARRDRSGRAAPVAVNLARELSELERFGPVLDALPGPAYLVGGTVRDLLRRHPPRFDFDVAVVGDAEAYAAALAGRL